MFGLLVTAGALFPPLAVGVCCHVPPSVLPRFLARKLVYVSCVLPPLTTEKPEYLSPLSKDARATTPHFSLSDDDSLGGPFRPCRVLVRKKGTKARGGTVRPLLKTYKSISKGLGGGSGCVWADTQDGSRSKRVARAYFQRGGVAIRGNQPLWVNPRKKTYTHSDRRDSGQCFQPFFVKRSRTIATPIHADCTKNPFQE